MLLDKKMVNAEHYKCTINTETSDMFAALVNFRNP